jgi:hypothetical protein
MASIRKETVIDVQPEVAWAAVRDFGAVAERLVPGVLTASKLEDGARVVTFANGVVARELLVDIDDGAMRLVYASVGGRATHHNASMQVVAEPDGRTRLVWITDVLPNELADAVRDLVEQGSLAMARILGSSTLAAST